MILKDGSHVPDARVELIMTELHHHCSRFQRRVLRQAAYGHPVLEDILQAHPVLLYKGKLSAAAAAVIMCAVRPDGSLVNPGQE